MHGSFQSSGRGAGIFGHKSSGANNWCMTTVRCNREIRNLSSDDRDVRAGGS
jgi:hypothetical protein